LPALSSQSAEQRNLNIFFVVIIAPRKGHRDEIKNDKIKESKKIHIFHNDKAGSHHTSIGFEVSLNLPERIMDIVVGTNV